MKKYLLLLTCTFVLALTACRKPEPGIDPIGNETTDTLVKKYLVKQLLNDDPERIMLAIDWNGDCSKILHVKYGLGSGPNIDYDFIYYDNDSIQVTWSVSDDISFWSFWYNRIMIHLTDDRIDSVCCFVGNDLKDVEYYFYNEENKLIKRSYYNGAANDVFRWEGDGVVEYEMMENNTTVVFDTFTNYIHPHYTLPFYLSSEVAYEIRQPLFNPLWKYQPIHPLYKEYQADENGYITKLVHKNSSDSSERCITFYYRTAN